MPEGKYFSTTDILGVIIVFLAIAGFGFLYNSNAIDGNTVMVGMLAMLLLIAGRHAIPAIIISQFQKQLEGKSIEDYWQQTKNQINNTPTKYEFSYNYQLPEEYFPYNNIELGELGLVLFEINRDDLSAYSETNETYTLFPYPILTLIVKTDNGKIKGTMRGKDLTQTTNFIKENIELFRHTSNRLILPERISTIDWGQPITTSQTTEPEGKK